MRLQPHDNLSAVDAIPRSLDAIEPRWLTDALRVAGHESPTVESVSVTPMAGVVGALGEVGVLDVTYSETGALPDRFVAKCPLDDDQARLYNRIMQNYTRESGFYRDAADAVGLLLPRCYINAIDDTGDHAVLILDHISPAEAGDILRGTSFDQLRSLVVDLASMHGRFWLDPRLHDHDWAFDWSTPSFLAGIEVTAHGWAAFTAAEPDYLPADLRDVLAATWVNDTKTWLARYDERPWTLTHGDYELDNMMFRADGSVVILDWQTVMRTFPGLDLGWMLACSADEAAIERETELFDAYRDALLQAGGPALSADDVAEDCAWAMLYHLTGQTVTNTVTYPDTETGHRARARFRHMLDGCRAGALRWDTAGRIGEYL